MSNQLILAALDNVARKVNTEKYSHEVLEQVTSVPIFERDAGNWCSMFVGDTEDVYSGGKHYGDGYVTKVRCDVFKVVFWGEYPEDEHEGYGEEPDPIFDAEQIIKDVVEEEVSERLGVDVEVISKESELYHPMGGWAVYVKSKKRYSIDLLRRKSRVIES